jgi:hypothetical protein
MVSARRPNFGDSGSTAFRVGAMRFRLPSRALSPAEGIMPIYRAYLIDKDDRVESYKPVEANDDEKALEAARQLVDGHDVEVWFLDRLVGRLSKQV